MKRPLALLGGAAFAALVFAAYFGAGTAEKMLPICVGLGFCTLFAAIAVNITNRKAEKLLGKMRPRAFSALACAAAVLLTGSLCLGRFCSASKTASAVDVLYGAKAQVRGVVLDYPTEQYNKTYYKIRLERISVDGSTLDLPQLTIRVSTQNPFACEPYDTVECTVKLYEFSTEGGLYSTKNSRLADGIAAGGYIADYTNVRVIADTAASPSELAARWRHMLARSIEQHLPDDEAGLLRTMLLGERETLSDNIYADFKRIGASHILVVSGMHMAALAACVSALIAALHLKKRAANLLTAAVMLVFLAIIGFPVSAVRGVIMYIVVLLGECLGRRADSVNSLGLAVLVICVVQPFSGGDLGFALSVTSTLGIVLFADRFTKIFISILPHHPRPRKLLTPVASSIAVTMAGTVLTLPIQAAVFGGVSLMTPIASLLLIPPCTVLLYSSLGVAVCGAIPVLSAVAKPMAIVSGWLARYVIAVAGALADVHGTFLQLTDGVWVAVLIAWLLLALVPVFIKKRTAVCFTAVAMAAVFVCGVAFEGGGSGTVTIAANSSCVIMLQNRKAAVLCLGGYNTSAAENLLNSNNVSSVELLCMPVRDSNARKAAVNILNSLPTEKIAVPAEGYFGRDLMYAAKGAQRCYLEDGDELEVLSGVKITTAADMNRLTVTANGVPIIIETEYTGGGECAVLFTNQSESKINSSFTVLQNDDIIEQTDLLALATGRYILPSGNWLYCRLHANGEISFKGESMCLK